MNRETLETAKGIALYLSIFIVACCVAMVAITLTAVFLTTYF